MALMRWEPFAEIESMRRTMDRMLEHFGGMPAFEHMRGLSPKVEVYATENEVVVSAELPGIDMKDVEIELTEDAVHLAGELKRESEVQEDNYYRSERHYGHFDRLIPLPQRIRPEEAKASAKAGVLTIRAPFAEPVKKPQARKLSIDQVE